MISHDQLDAILAAATHAATLTRGVYMTLHFGVPFLFTVKSDGSPHLGLFLPDDVTREEMEDRLLDRLDLDDQPKLRLLA